MGAIGRYLLTPEIFDCIKQTKRGAGNEVQLTDGIRLLKDFQKVYGLSFDGRRYDTGDKIGYIETILNFTLKDEELKDIIFSYFREISIR